MGLENKLKGVVENATGKVKEVTGKATGNEELQVEGRIEQIEAEIRQQAERAKDGLTS
jgi:uncharacterized protein YjbJ (UPF0337 family)